MMKRITALLLMFALAVPLASCDQSGTPEETENHPAAADTSLAESTAPVTGTERVPDETEKPEEPEGPYDFYGTISEKVLNNYLSRAVTISCENGELNLGNTAIVNFIRNIGAKYIARANTEWSPSKKNAEGRPVQKAFIDEIHKTDPDVVFEACIFECVSGAVNEIPIPAYVFEAFGKKVEDRCFSFDKMVFKDGRFKDQWGAGTAVPDITQGETQMFFYYRACDFIDTGFEGLHMGQVELMGQRDTNHRSYTKLFKMIRAYAKEHARRGFVFINAHTHGIVGSDGVLLFDFHGYPLRSIEKEGEGPHRPTEDYPQGSVLKVGARGSIYGNSMGGTTYSGWTCKSLPYLVEFDNYGMDNANLHKPSTVFLWGMDDISWFANQPASYRREWLRYSLEWVNNLKDHCAHLAMPGMRVAHILNDADETVSWQYKAFSDKFGDEDTIKALWDEFFPLN